MLAGCQTGPDYTPIGRGLTAIGICLVCMAVVEVLGRLVDRDHDNKD